MLEKLVKSTTIKLTKTDDGQDWGDKQRTVYL